MLRTLRRESVDRPPFWLMRQAGRFLPEYRAVRAKAGHFLKLCYTPELATEVTMQPVRRFRTDAAILFADILLVPHGLGQALDFREGEGPVLEPIRSAGEVDRQLSLARLDDVLSPVYSTVRALREALPAEVALIGFAGAPWTVATYMVEGRGSSDHAAAKRWATADPEGFGRLVERLVEATVRYLDRQVQAGADVVQLFDTWAGALPEPMYRRWCIAPTARIVGALKARHPGLPVIGFPRGSGAMYEAYVAGSSVDALGLDSSVPLGWAGERLGRKVALQGNLDPQVLVVGGAAMAEEAKRILTALAGTPHVFNLGHGVVPETPPAHVEALAELLHGWRS